MERSGCFEDFAKTCFGEIARGDKDKRRVGMEETMKKGMIAGGILLLACCGCSLQKQEEKVSDLPFHVVEQKEIPEELMEIIDEKKDGAFHMTYEDGDTLYIVVGYGKMQTGGYSIEVPQFYLTKDSIVIDTNLIGPQKEAVRQASYPYIVVSTEWREEMVDYQ